MPMSRLNRLLIHCAMVRNNPGNGKPGTLRLIADSCKWKAVMPKKATALLTCPWMVAIALAFSRAPSASSALSMSFSTVFRLPESFHTPTMMRMPAAVERRSGRY
eukprot:COSAG06_NODE_3860_length_4823_cov_4.086367_3_plen_105_part_00